MTDPTKQTPPQGATQQAAGEPGKANSTVMVVVGCKLPNGLLCEVGKMGDDNHTRVRLNGTNDARVIGGYGLTDVSKEFWDTWYKKNRHLEFVRKGFVFVHGDAASAADEAKDRAGVLNGMEPLPQTGADPRVKGLLGPDGKPMVETDLNHLAQGKTDVAQFGRAAAR